MIVCRYVVAFFFYSLLGYLYESVYSTINHRHWANRGFFFGPIIPIYGISACIANIVFYDLGIPFLQNATWYTIFLISFFGSMIIEYVTSYVLEKLFHAKWWDYSDSFCNINGRVCLFASTGFGIAGIVVVKWLIPFVNMVLGYFPEPLLAFLSLLFVLFFGADAALTLSALTNFQKNFIRIEKEMNEQMSEVYTSLEASYLEKKALMDKKVAELVQASSWAQKDAISRVSFFKYEGKKRRIANSFWDELHTVQTKINTKGKASYKKYMNKKR